MPRDQKSVSKLKNICTDFTFDNLLLAKVYEFNDNGLDTVRSALSATAATKLGELSRALQDGEWDADPAAAAAAAGARPPPPVAARAGAYKAEIREAEGMGRRVEARESSIKELKLALRWVVRVKMIL